MLRIGRTQRPCRASPVFLCAVLLLVWIFVPCTPACAAAHALEGLWTIDVDATLKVNADWREVYDSVKDKDKQELRANWTSKKLEVDLAAAKLRVFSGGKVTQQGDVIAQRDEEGALILRIRPDDTEVGRRKRMPPYDISMVLRDDGSMRAVLAGYTVIIFTRPKTGDD